ncbi:hypothetical protein NBM05_03725 [Rothia sp. AR01]|uniref:Uncharacterized protein n=1 Tax=Rothia santali TaxID=2949643 RepID=A0A9X2HJ13_9MICC|nr:hypothetical protein [Rothia santali]MCP3425158.1 hypothetical protein [Rothia santali]
MSPWRASHPTHYHDPYFELLLKARGYAVLCGNSDTSDLYFHDDRVDQMLQEAHHLTKNQLGDDTPPDPAVRVVDVLMVFAETVNQIRRELDKPEYPLGRLLLTMELNVAGWLDDEQLTAMRKVLLRRLNGQP